MKKKRLLAAAGAALASLGMVPAPAFAIQGPSTTTVPPAAATTTTTVPTAQAELLVDLDTGKALFEQADHAALPPGSLTKMLTAMIAADWLPPGIGIPVSPVAANASPTRVGMKAGQVWPYAEVMGALLVDSANDAAYALAERVSGSLAGFATTMSDAARQIGMIDHPVLQDPAGLDGSEGFNGGNRISAWDLAIAGRDMMADPALAAIAGTWRYQFTGPDGIVYSLRNQNVFFLATYPGAVGVKTGYTDAAGFCVVEEAVRGNRHMLAVVLHGNNSFATAAALLDSGFATPVSAESPKAPRLPAAVRPVPDPPAAPAKRPVMRAADPAPVVLAARAPAPRRGNSPDWPEAAAALVMLGGIGFTLSRMTRRRLGA